jgi:hypothetical protein
VDRAGRSHAQPPTLPRVAATPRVVVTAGWKLRALTVLTGAMAVGLWPNAIGVLGGGLDDEGRLPWAAEVLVVVLLWTFTLACTAATWGVWWFRQTFTADEVTVRVLGPTGRIRFDTATSLHVGEARVHTGRLGGVRRYRQLKVTGPGKHGLPTTAGVDSTMRSERAAQAVLLGWARRRPELVSDDETRSYLDEIEHAAVADLR